MLAQLIPASTMAIGFLVICLILVFAFEATNGFHDTANAVATVIYTNALTPIQAVIWSGLMNFIGVIVGGIAVAYALVEIMPADVLSPPNGAPAIPMLIALFVSALFWNVLTWAFGLPNSSSHCLIGALVGIALGDCLVHARPLADGVDWTQIWTVLRALALSPVLGFVLAGLLYTIVRALVRAPELYRPPEGDTPPVCWMRAILILTCTGVSFSHGTNDGQKSIGLIMLTVIGLLPAVFGLNPQAGPQLGALHRLAAEAQPLIARYGDDRKTDGIAAAHFLETAPVPDIPRMQTIFHAGDGVEAAGRSGRADAVSAMRNAVYTVMAELKHAAGLRGIAPADKAHALALRGQFARTVEYAPWWVRLLSGLCLGIGTMIGYRRVVRTLGERLGKTHMTPGQGASAELVSAVLIGTAGFSGLPVSTTHIVTSGIAGTMVAAHAGLQRRTITRILLAWIFTLPVTIVIAAAMFYLLAGRV